MSISPVFQPPQNWGNKTGLRGPRWERNQPCSPARKTKLGHVVVSDSQKEAH